MSAGRLFLIAPKYDIRLVQSGYGLAMTRRERQVKYIRNLAYLISKYFAWLELPGPLKKLGAMAVTGVWKMVDGSTAQ